MRSELCLLATLWLLGLGGCRQLLDPEPSAVAPPQSTIRIQRPNGNYVTDYELWLFRRSDAIGYTNLGELLLTQVGFETTRQFHVPAPGIYTLWIDPGGIRDADFTLEDVELPADLEIVAPYEWVSGSVVFPSGFAWSWASSSRLRCYTRSKKPLSTSSSFERDITFDLDPDGTYEGWLPAGEFVRRVDLWSLTADFEITTDRVNYPEAAQLPLAVELRAIDIAFLLHGTAATSLDLAVRGSSSELDLAETFNFRHPLDVVAGSARIWLPPGLHELIFDSLVDSFMPRYVSLRVIDDATISIELARYAVQFVCRDSQGNPLGGQRVRLGGDGPAFTNLTTDVAGVAQTLVMPGWLTVRLNDVVYPDVEVTGDSTFELTWP